MLTGQCSPVNRSDEDGWNYRQSEALVDGLRPERPVGFIGAEGYGFVLQCFGSGTTRNGSGLRSSGSSASAGGAAVGAAAPARAQVNVSNRESRTGVQSSTIDSRKIPTAIARM